MSAENIKKRLQLISLDGVIENPELSKLAEKCFYAKNETGINCGETGTLYPIANITIIPFRYEWCVDNKEEFILKHLEDAIEINEKYIKADRIVFPLMELKAATKEGYKMLGNGGGFDSISQFNFAKDGKPDGLKGSSTADRERQFVEKWCCFGHYYLVLIKKALNNRGYFSMEGSANDLSNLRNEIFRNKNGSRLMILADAGM